MSSLAEYLQQLEDKPLASSLESLKQSQAALDKLCDPATVSSDLIEKELAMMSPEFYSFLFKQADIETTGSIDESLTNAITKLGFKNVKKLIFFHIAYSSETADDASSMDRMFAAHLWSQNYQMASIAAHWAGYLMEDKVEEIFYLGMLQNIGISAFAQLEPSKHRAIRESIREIPLGRKEKEHFGFSHYELGAAIVDKWGLPQIHKSAMRYEETHGQRTEEFIDEETEDLFMLLYFGKYRAAMKESKRRSDELSLKMRVDPFFNYDELLIQVMGDRLREIKRKRA